jgi:hypothetical protein
MVYTNNININFSSFLIEKSIKNLAPLDDLTIVASSMLRFAQRSEDREPSAFASLSSHMFANLEIKLKFDQICVLMHSDYDYKMVTCKMDFTILSYSCYLYGLYNNFNHFVLSILYLP